MLDFIAYDELPEKEEEGQLKASQYFWVNGLAVILTESTKRSNGGKSISFTAET